MFSIPVSELTPELLAKAEYWRLFAQRDDGRMWADTRHRDSLCVLSEEESPYPLLDRHSDFNAYAGHIRCFPVAFAPDGTETRLEMPQMPDEVEIEGLSGVQTTHRPMIDALDAWVFYVCLLAENVQDIVVFAPTPEHYPRLALGGPWVWSTRR